MTATAASPGVTTDGATPAPRTASGLRPASWRDIRPGRIVGLDLARMIALIAMILVHTNPSTNPDGSSRWWWELSVGRSAALFAVLAGVGLALITGGYHRFAGRELARRRVVLVNRALMIFLVGLLLGQLDTYVRVILCMYATIFLFAIPLIAWSVRSLVLLAVAWGVAGPLLWMALCHAWFGFPEPKENITLAMLGDPLHLVNVLFVTGNYPVLVWVTYVIVGMVIGRLPLTRALTQWQLVAVGGAMYAAAKTISALAPVGSKLSWAGQLHDIAHSGTVIDLLNTIGFSLAVIGLSLVVASRAPRFWTVVSGAGTMALTLYAVHIVLTLPTVAPLLPGPPFPWHLGIFLLIGCTFGVLQRQGPLESLVAVVSKWVGKSVVRGV